MTAYPFWTEDELDERRTRSIEIFVESWGPELQDEFIELKAECAEVVRELFEESDYLRELKGDPDFFNTRAHRPLLAPARFMTVPQLSNDNFKVIAKALGKVETLLGLLSRERFSWMYDNTNPTDEQVERAVDVTAELWAIQRQATSKRMESSREQERQVRAKLAASGLTELPLATLSERIKALADAGRYSLALGITPANLRDVLNPGEFISEHLVMGHKSDVPILLASGVLMTTECKVSNSATNSYKRLIRETDGKRRAWKEEFGRGGVRTAAVIGGVYSLKNLNDAQREGMLLFFDHDLDALDAFVQAGGEPRNP